MPGIFIFNAETTYWKNIMHFLIRKQIFHDSKLRTYDCEVIKRYQLKIRSNVLPKLEKILTNLPETVMT